jgi:flagellar biosynthesis protein FlhG
MGLVVESFQQSIGAAPVTAASLIRCIESVDPLLADKMRQVCGQYHPRIIFNMGDHPDELKIAPKIDSTLKRGLSMEAEFFGFVAFDDAVRKSAKRKEVLMIRHSQSVAAQCIGKIAADVSKNWERPFSDNISHLMEETRRNFEAAAGAANS